MDNSISRMIDFAFIIFCCICIAGLFAGIIDFLETQEPSNDGAEYQDIPFDTLNQESLVPYKWAEDSIVGIDSINVITYQDSGMGGSWTKIYTNPDEIIIDSWPDKNNIESTNVISGGSNCFIGEDCEYIYLKDCHNVIVENGSHLYLEGIHNRRYELKIDSVFEDGQYFDEKGFWIWHKISTIDD